MHLLQLRVDRVTVAFLVFVNDLEDLREGLDALTNVVAQVVEHYRYGHRVVDIHTLALVVGLQVQEQVVLRCQSAVALHVVHKLLQAVLADEIVLDTSRSRLPFEVVKTVVVVVSRFPARVKDAVAAVVPGLRATARLKDALDQLRVVAWSDDVLERLRLVLLVSILGDVGVLGECLLARLQELLLLLSGRLKRIRQSARREVAVLLGLLRLSWLGAALAFSFVVVGVLASVLVAALRRVRCDSVGSILLFQICVLVVHANLQLGVETASRGIFGARLVLRCASLPVAGAARRTTHRSAQFVALDGALSAICSGTRPLAVHGQLGLHDASIRAGSVVIHLHSVTARTILLISSNALEVYLLLVLAEDAVQELLKLLLAVFIAYLEGTASVLLLRRTSGDATLRPWLPVQITGLISVRIIINVGSLLILIIQRVEIDVDRLLASNGRCRVFH